jgi:hypothetical protein
MTLLNSYDFYSDLSGTSRRAVELEPQMKKQRFGSQETKQPAEIFCRAYRRRKMPEIFLIDCLFAGIEQQHMVVCIS